MRASPTGGSKHWRVRFLSWLDAFVPASVLATPEDAQRARLLVGFSLAVAAVAVPPPLISLWLHGGTAAAGIPLALALFCVSIPVLLRHTGAVRGLGLALCLAGIFTTATVAVLDGYLSSHAIIWFPFATIIAAYLAGVRAAVVTTVLSLVAVSALYWLSMTSTIDIQDIARLQVRLASTVSAAVFGCVMGIGAELGRRRYRTELTRAESRTQTLLDLLPDAALHLDSEDRVITTVLPEQCRLGLTRTDPLGRHIDDVLERPLAAAYHQWRTSGALPPRPVEIRTADELRFVALLASEFAGGEVVVILRDLTERERLDRIKDDFVSTVSHELRTPLTAITASLRLLDRGAMGEMRPEARELVAVACRNSDRLAEVIDDILDFQRIEAGALTYTFESLNCLQLLGEAVQLNLQSPRARGIDLTIAPGIPPDLSIRADPGRIQQVLGNLVSNAVRHSPPGSAVVLAASQIGNHQVRIEVRDKGSGIPEEFQSQVFERFAQAARPRGAGQPGSTGLGLAICKRIVEDHGGSIGFESDPATGTVFWILLGEAEESLDRQGA